jgi:hypothetical protein
MRYPHLNDAKHWQVRAAKMRAMAENLGNPNAARLMHDLANDYDKLASRAEGRAKPPVLSPSPIWNIHRANPSKTDRRLVQRRRGIV